MTGTDWLDQLEQKAAAAKAATHGLPWVKDPDDPSKVLASNDGGWDGSLIATIPGDDYGLIEESVTDHIAAANPHTVQRLIRELRVARDVIDRWEEQYRLLLEHEEKARAVTASVEAALDDAPHTDVFTLDAAIRNALNGSTR